MIWDFTIAIARNFNMNTVSTLASLISCQHMAGQMDMPSRQETTDCSYPDTKMAGFHHPVRTLWHGWYFLLSSQCVRATVCPLSSSDIRTRWQNPGEWLNIRQIKGWAQGGLGHRSVRTAPSSVLKLFLQVKSQQQITCMLKASISQFW